MIRNDLKYLAKYETCTAHDYDEIKRELSRVYKLNWRNLRTIHKRRNLAGLP